MRSGDGVPSAVASARAYAGQARTAAVGLGPSAASAALADAADALLDSLG